MTHTIAYAATTTKMPCPPWSCLGLATLLWLAALSSPRSCSASQSLETADFADVIRATRSYVAQFGADRVLVVVDVDNTLLAMDRPLGSDQWFEWQEHLLANEPDSPDLVARDFAGLLDAQGLLFAAGTMHPPQAEQPKLVRELQDLGVVTLVLTSRGDEFRAAALRELKRNGYEFADSSPAIRLFRSRATGITESACRWTPYDFNDPTTAGLTLEERQRFALSPTPRDISYGDGLVMTAGQHKGAMLLVMLALMGREFDAIVFADDHLRNVHRVYDALAGRNLEVTTIHYKREEPNVKRFAYGDKSQVNRDWRRLKRALAADPPPVESAAP